MMYDRFSFFFFFNDTATTEIYTHSLLDALQISTRSSRSSTPWSSAPTRSPRRREPARAARGPDRKSTRLNSSHVEISYADFCLKKKNKSLYCYQLHVSTPRRLLLGS